MTKDEFYSQLETWTSKPIETWNHITMVAWFHLKYFKKNGSYFVLSNWRGNPASSKEAKDISKLFDIFAHASYDMMEASEKKEEKIRVYKKIVAYIDWLFNYKFRNDDKCSAVTTQYFFSPQTINQFTLMYNKHLDKQIAKTNAESIFTWIKSTYPEVYEAHQFESDGDLDMFIKYAESYDFSDKAPESAVKRKILEYRESNVK